MRRREFVWLLGGAAAWPLAAPAQQASKLYRIGYLSLGSVVAEASRYNAFRTELAALGYVEGKNLVIETRWLDGGKYDQLAELAAQLVDLKVDIIVTATTPGVSAVKRATTTIPNVFASVGDAVAMGLLSSLARPGSNVTGTSYFLPELAAKRVELLKEALPGLVRAGVLFNPANPAALPVLEAMRVTARSLQLELSEFAAREASDLEDGFAAMAAKSVGAFVLARSRRFRGEVLKAQNPATHRPNGLPTSKRGHRTVMQRPSAVGSKACANPFRRYLPLMNKSTADFSLQDVHHPKRT